MITCEPVSHRKQCHMRKFLSVRDAFCTDTKIPDSGLLAIPLPDYPGCSYPGFWKVSQAFGYPGRWVGSKLK